MASDTDPWASVHMADWSAEGKITIRGKNNDSSDAHPLEMPLSWVVDMMTRWRERNPANFGNELAETTKRWAQGKIGGEK